jgi:hypothetical protein
MTTGDAVDRELWRNVRGARDLSPRGLATRVMAVVLWMLVCSSAASGFLALARVQAVRDAPTATPGLPVGLEGFAELAVSAFVEGSEASVGTLFAGVVPSPAPGLGRPGERFVARASAVGVRPAGADTWRVRVGAEVLVAAEGGYRRDGAHWFEVSISRRGDGFVATSLPTEVLAPAGRPGS